MQVLIEKIRGSEKWKQAHLWRTLGWVSVCKILCFVTSFSRVITGLRSQTTEEFTQVLHNLVDSFPSPENGNKVHNTHKNWCPVSIANTA